jgi:hypothetical protein
LAQIGRPPAQIIEGPYSITSGLIDFYEHVVAMELLPRFASKLDALAGDPPVQASIADAIPLHAITAVEEGIAKSVLVASESPFQWSDEQTAIRASELRRALVEAAEKQRPVVIRCRGVDHPVLAMTLMDQPVRWVTVGG